MTDMILPQLDLHPQTTIVWVDRWLKIERVELRPDGDSVYLSDGTMRLLQPSTLALLVDMRSEQFRNRPGGFAGMDVRLSSSGGRTRIAEVKYPAED